MKTLHSVLFALAVSVSAPAFAQSVTTPSVPVTQFAPKDVKEVRMLLSGYHGIAPKAAFEAIPNGAAIVGELANGSHSMIRDRALAALGQYWPSGDVYLLYANVIADPATATGTLHRVVAMYAYAFGERALPVLEPLLRADDVQLQITAVRAIGSIGADASHAMLLDFANEVTNPQLLDELDKAARVLR